MHSRRSLSAFCLGTSRMRHAVDVGRAMRARHGVIQKQQPFSQHRAWSSGDPFPLLILCRVLSCKQCLWRWHHRAHTHVCLNCRKSVGLDLDLVQFPPPATIRRSDRGRVYGLFGHSPCHRDRKWSEPWSYGSRRLEVYQNGQRGGEKNRRRLEVMAKWS